LCQDHVDMGICKNYGSAQIDGQVTDTLGFCLAVFMKILPKNIDHSQTMFRVFNTLDHWVYLIVA